MLPSQTNVQSLKFIEKVSLAFYQATTKRTEEKLGFQGRLYQGMTLVVP